MANIKLKISKYLSSTVIDNFHQHLFLFFGTCAHTYLTVSLYTLRTIDSIHPATASQGTDTHTYKPQSTRSCLEESYQTHH